MHRHVVGEMFHMRVFARRRKLLHRRGHHLRVVHLRALHHQEETCTQTECCKRSVALEMCIESVAGEGNAEIVTAGEANCYTDAVRGCVHHLRWILNTYAQKRARLMRMRQR